MAYGKLHYERSMSYHATGKLHYERSMSYPTLLSVVHESPWAGGVDAGSSMR